MALNYIQPFKFYIVCTRTASIIIYSYHIVELMINERKYILSYVK